MDRMTDKNDQTTLAELAEKLGVTVEDLLSHCRKAELVDARCMVAALLMNRPCMRQQDVAPILDISQAAVSKLLTRHLQMLRYTNYRLQWEALQNG